MKPITELKPKDYTQAMDYRGIPTEVCPCGCEVFNVMCCFEKGEIVFYFLDMECASCGSMATAPTVMDESIGYSNNV